MSEPVKLHADLEALLGTVIHGRYRVDALLGVGGMGAVFRGHHLGLHRDVAIKLLHPRIGGDPAVSKRFDREATSASRLDHPNCVRVTDFGTTDNGAKYMVMEFLEGHELEASLGQPLPVDHAVQIAGQVLEGLEHAHQCGVVHRDLKPANIYMTRNPRGQEVVKLVDFGIAKLIDEQGGQDKLTREGMVFGTPRYMSPEQATGGKIDERTDLYAVGLILYEMLSGKPPFEADNPGQLLRMQVLADPPPLPATVPEPLAKLVARLLEKSRSDRPASAREVLDAVAEIGREPLIVAAPVPVATVPVVTPWADAPHPSHSTGSGPASYPSAPVMFVAPPSQKPASKPFGRPLIWAIVGAMLLALMTLGAVFSAIEASSDPTPIEQAPTVAGPQPAGRVVNDDDDDDEDSRESSKRAEEQRREAKKREEEQLREAKKRAEEQLREGKKKHKRK